MKKCPFCEGEISNTAKKCKHCGERLPKEKKIPEKPNNKLGTFLSEYGIFLIIGGFIIYYLLRPSNQTNNINIQENLDSKPNGYTTNITYKVKGEGYDEYIESNEYGYKLFSDQIGECNINTEDEIKKLVKAIDNANIGDIIKWSCPSETNTQSNFTQNGKNISIFLDNSYSKNLDGDLVKDGPSKRLNLLKNYMNNQTVPLGSSIDFVFMFSIQPKENAEEPDKNVYHFDINPSNFEIIYKKDGEGSISYDAKRHTINRWDIKINASIGGYKGTKKCINAGSDSYVCYDAESVYQEIEDIYNTIYNKEDKHTNNLLIKTLSMSKDRFSKFNKDEIFIFTNGEFIYGYEYEDIYLNKLKQKYKTERGHDQGADKDHNLAEFNERNTTRYQRDKNQKYKSFQMEAIEAIRKEIPECNDVNIHIIGLTRSAEFNPLAREIYKKIFEPCTVLFEN